MTTDTTIRLGTVRLFVDDLVAAKHFYEAALGLRLVHDGSGDGYLLFDAGAVSLVVEPVARDAPPDDRALVGRFTGVSFRVDDVDAAHARLIRQGVRFTDPPARQLWGGWTATFVDPCGNELQLAQHPG